MTTVGSGKGKGGKVPSSRGTSGNMGHGTSSGGGRPDACDAVNLLDISPTRRCRWRSDENGRVVLEVERFRRPYSRRLAYFLDFKMKRRVHLDERGSAVWRLCNGKRTVYEIAGIIRSRFGEDRELYGRLATFLTLMENNGLVGLDLGSKGGKKGSATAKGSLKGAAKGPSDGPGSKASRGPAKGTSRGIKRRREP